MNLIRNILTGLLVLGSSSILSAQKAPGRNQSVHALNSITTYLNQAFYINVSAYTDIRFFSSSYVHNLERPGTFSWQIYDNKNSRVRYDFGVDFKDYPEIKPDAEGFITSWQNDWLNMLKTRRQMEARLAPLRLPADGELMWQLNLFSQNLDSMLQRHDRIVQYVYRREFEQDAPQYEKAYRLIMELQACFPAYRNTLRALYRAMETLYNEKWAPLRTQPVIQEAEKEIRRSAELAQAWEEDLYNGISTGNAAYDAALRRLNAEGLARDSALFARTYGYDSPSHGAMPHTRYVMFFKMMHSSLYHYAGGKTYYESYMENAPQDYNRFTFGYNSLMEYYNRFADCADGSLLSADMDYSMPMAARLGVDTAQNPLLHRPKTGMLFIFKGKTRELPPPPDTLPTALPPDSVAPSHETMIQNALPHHLIYLVDVSSSMRANGQLDSMKAAISYLVRLQRPQDRISLLTFSSEAHRFLSFIPCDNKTHILSVIRDLNSGGGTEAGKGLAAAYALADSCLAYEGKTRILLATDGVFHLDKRSEKRITQYAQKGVRLSILLSGHRHEKSTLDYYEKLSTGSGGLFYRVGAAGLKDVLVKEATE